MFLFAPPVARRKHQLVQQASVHSAASSSERTPSPPPTTQQADAVPDLVPVDESITVVNPSNTNKRTAIMGNSHANTMPTVQAALSAFLNQSPASNIQAAPELCALLAGNPGTTGTNSHSTNKKRFACPVAMCNESCSSRFNLSRHMERKHPGYEESQQLQPSCAGQKRTVSIAQLDESTEISEEDLSEGGSPETGSQACLTSDTSNTDVLKLDDIPTASENPANSLQPASNHHEEGAKSGEQILGAHFSPETPRNLVMQDTVANVNLGQDQTEMKVEQPQEAGAEENSNGDGNSASVEDSMHEGSSPESAAEKRSCVDVFSSTLRTGMNAVERHVATCCEPFLRWLCASPVTEIERAVKVRRVTSERQLRDYKEDLNYIIRALISQPKLLPNGIDLEIFTRLEVCQSLGAFQDSRSSGPSRVYALFLLIKKILVYLSTQDSLNKGQLILPNSYASWTYVDRICAESKQRQKEIAANKKHFGDAQSKLLQFAHRMQAGTMPAGMPDEAFQMPPLYSSASSRKKFKTDAVASPVVVPRCATLKPVPSAPGSAAMSSNNTSIPRTPTNESVVVKKSTSPVAIDVAAVMNAAAAAAASSEGITEYGSVAGPSANELTPEELRVITQGSLAYLRSREPALFVAHLVTATLCLALAPRQQVLRQLQIGVTFVREEKGYWVRIPAEMSKNHKPISFPLVTELSEAYDYYLTTLRPQMLVGIPPQQRHRYVFCKRNGEPVGDGYDFSAMTQAVTMRLIGRPVNPHAFRKAVVTTAYTQGNATTGGILSLASIMGHDLQTARNHYFRPNAEQTARDTSEGMRDLLLSTGASSRTSGEGQLEDLEQSTRKGQATQAIFASQDRETATAMDTEGEHQRQVSTNCVTA